MKIEMSDERLKMWLSFARFILGAGGISLITALTTLKLHKQQLEIEVRNKEQDYLKEFVTGALNKDLTERRDFAQYFATISLSDESRSRWGDYLEIIEGRIREEYDKIIQQEDSIKAIQEQSRHYEEQYIELKERLEELSQRRHDDKKRLRDSLSNAVTSLNKMRQEIKERRERVEIAKSEVNAKLVEKSKPAVLQVPEHFFGTWFGKGKQTSGDAWTIRVSLAPSHYRIEYPSLECGGSLELLTVTDKMLTFRETLEFGKSKCVDQGQMVLSPKNDKGLKYMWYYPNGSFGAEGNLEKIEEYPQMQRQLR